MSRKYNEDAHEWMAIWCRGKKLDLSRITGKRRTKMLTEQRHEAMYAVRSMNYSFPEVGDAANRDHSSAKYAHKKFRRERMKTTLATLAVLATVLLSGCSACPHGYYQPEEDPSICIGKFKLMKSKGISI